MKKIYLIVAIVLVTGFQYLYSQNVDISVNITGARSIQPSSSSSFKIYVANNGNVNATNINLIYPALVNFTVNSVTCATGGGNDGYSTCPGTMSVANFQTSGLTIPSLPAGSSVVLTVNGSSGSFIGNINHIVTALVGSPFTDVDLSNNTINYQTKIIGNGNCGLSRYRLNVDQTIAQNGNGTRIIPNGGTINLVYSLDSGTAVNTVGSSFNVPVAFSDLVNNSGTDNQWGVLNKDGSDLMVAIYNAETTGGIFNNLPLSHRPQTPSPYFTDPYYVSYLNGDRALTRLFAINQLEPLGTFKLSVGDVPSLPNGVYVHSKKMETLARGTINFSTSEMYSGYFLKPIIQNEVIDVTANSAYIKSLEFDNMQSYTWRYTAFRGQGEGISTNQRGVIFKADNYIRFGTDMKDYGNLPTAGTIYWKEASATLASTALGLNRVWLGNDNGYPNVACNNNVVRNDGLSISGDFAIAGSGTESSPFVFGFEDWQSSFEMKFHVTVNGNASPGVPVYYGIWFDANGNGTFTDSEDVFLTGSRSHGSPQTVELPFQLIIGGTNTGATSGAIRVVATTNNYGFSKSQDGNVNVINGEVEDYYVAYPVALPVNYLKFSVIKSGKDVLLDWTTISEKNNKGFYIERRDHFSDWQSLGFVRTKSEEAISAGKLSYSYTDNSPVAGNNLYRLKQVDLDGKVSYSPVAGVDFSNSETVSIYPNPVNSNRLTISGFSNKASLMIKNSIGEEIKTESVVNKRNHTVNVSSLKSGLYYLLLIGTDAKVETYKFIKE